VKTLNACLRKKLTDERYSSFTPIAMTVLLQCACLSFLFDGRRIRC
jgi:hypothetical protein